MHYYQVKTVKLQNISSEQKVLYLVDITNLITAVRMIETFCDGKRIRMTFVSDLLFKIYNYAVSGEQGNIFNVIYFQICNRHINYSMTYCVFLLIFLPVKKKKKNQGHLHCQAEKLLVFAEALLKKSEVFGWTHLLVCYGNDGIGCIARCLPAHQERHCTS